MLITLDDVRAALRAGDLDGVRAMATGQPIMVAPNGGGRVYNVAVWAMEALWLDSEEGGPSQELRAAQLECLRYLMDVYPVVDVRPGEKVPLRAAVCSGRLDVVQLAHSRYPEIIVDERGSTPIFETLVTRDEATQIASYLLEHARPVTTFGASASPEVLAPLVLQFAIAHDNFDLVRALGKHGVDVRAPVPVHDHFKFRFRYSSKPSALPIGFAESTEMVELLESMGAQLLPSNESNPCEESALCPAIRSCATSHLKYLISRGISVSSSDEDGKTPLHIAAESGTAKEIEVLLAAGADVNARDHQGQTPLMSSLGYVQNASRYRALIRGGADLFARDDDGNHRLFALTEMPLCRVAVDRILELVEDGSEVDPRDVSDFACHLASRRFRDLALQLMQSSTFDPNVLGNRGTSAVHEAAAVNNSSLASIVDAALAKGFAIDARDRGGRTALMVAVSSANVGAVKALLERGADAELKAPAAREGGRPRPLMKLTRNPEILGLLSSHLMSSAVQSTLESGEQERDGGAVPDSVGSPRRSLGIL